MSNSTDNNDVVILAGARTPQGRLNGQLAASPPSSSAPTPFAAALDRQRA